MVRALPAPVAPRMPDEPKSPPTSRLARTGRVGGLVAGQSLRWAGTRAANLVRTPERAEAIFLMFCAVAAICLAVGKEFLEFLFG